VSGPTSKEIAALLALPDWAREALKGCVGPGWVIVRCGDAPEYFLLWDGHDTARRAAEEFSGWPWHWLPCDPLKIVAVAADASGWPGEAHVGTTGADRWYAQVARRTRVANGTTAHAAALSLLASAWGWP
jgi:hypothetical protein